MLKVYKASAGAGKTFRLTIEYIKHLIKNPYNYRGILAVTFTNKATEEMKMRILSQLYGLSRCLKSSDNYMKVIMKDFREIGMDDITEEVVRRNAGIALENMLHQYNYFRVETIDRFFQTVLRNLAHELGLTPNLKIELADKEIEYQAVDTWIDKLKDSDREMNWIMDFINSTMEDDKSWDIIGNLKAFGLELLKDEYKSISSNIEEKLTRDAQFFSKFTSTLNNIIKEADKRVEEIGNELWSYIREKDFNVEDFSYKSSGIGGFIASLSSTKAMSISYGARVIKCAEGAEDDYSGWVGKTAPSPLKELCSTTLKPKFVIYFKEIQQLSHNAKTAYLTIKNLSSLRLLSAIENEIHISNKENYRFLLSDTQTLLNRMIDSSDSPFIFEKIGAYIENIMIDEFQDTSRTQWQNFKVMLENCLAAGKESLIVGDVKQSIYRWRSGDWRLLANISSEIASQVDIHELRNNFRSATRVIDFNNTFFTHATDLISNEMVQSGISVSDATMFKDAYADVTQKYPPTDEPNGYVEIGFVEEEDSNEGTLKKIADTIIRLHAESVKNTDIAILVRSNDKIPLIVDYCQRTIEGINFVSEEAYKLEASPAVCIIIDAIRHILNPKDKITRATLVANYQRYINNSSLTSAEIIADDELPDVLTDNIEKMYNMPLYQLAEYIYNVLNLNSAKGQSVYLCSFFDAINDYLQRNVSDLNDFITYWDETLHKKTVEMPNNNGIRILTIHKSKGLEFKHVIVPFCDWRLEKSGGLLWCKAEKDPFDKLDAIPINFSKSAMTGTEYEDDYHFEHFQNLIDNLNLLYVAFTRAVDGLYIFADSKAKQSTRSKLLSDVLPLMTKDLDATFENGTFTYGELQKKKADDDSGEEEKEQNIFLIKEEERSVVVQTNDSTPVFVQSNQSLEFTIDEDDTETLQHKQYIRTGNVLHHLLANIRTKNDIGSAILDLEMQGMLNGIDLTADSLRQHLEECFNNETIADWFSDRWTLYNECTILTFDKTSSRAKEQRPDRVMTDGNETVVVDFKLSQEKKSYYEQVKKYVQLLEQMGHKNVRGYLWLVMSNKIIEVVK